MTLAYNLSNLISTTNMTAFYEPFNQNRILYDPKDPEIVQINEIVGDLTYLELLNKIDRNETNVVELNTRMYGT